MPWTSKSAIKHTKKAKTPRLKKAWTKAANAAKKEYGDDATAIRVANSADKKTKAADKRKKAAATRKVAKKPATRKPAVKRTTRKAT